MREIIERYTNREIDYNEACYQAIFKKKEYLGIGFVMGLVIGLLIGGTL